ncbi:MAG: nucleoside-diphosphate sugar epimerase/dehydratase, partial [Thermodesulfobacteriota bacterium]
MWRYTSLVDLINVAKASLSGSLLIVAVILMTHRFIGYPRSVFLLDMLLTFLFVGGVRAAIRLYYARRAGLRVFPGLDRMRGGGARRLLIIGAGDAAEKVIREIQGNHELDLEPVGLLDDERGSRGKFIHGVPILGGTELLSASPVDFDEILIAWSKVRGEEMRRIVELCERTGRPFRTVPAMSELIDGRVTVKSVRQVRVEDLLGRNELHLDEDEIARYLRGQRVLVTGAGGSIGSELVRQIGRFTPEALALFEISELNLFRAEMDVRRLFPDLGVTPYLGDIRDAVAVDRVFSGFRPQAVFHAAAYKHVPMQEVFPWEAVHNNVLGTLNLVTAARDEGVERFVLVSTDKAVWPTNVMGATKRVAEMFVECLNNESATRFMAVRFGNVMESSGSAIPVFRDQIARGGPVTVTHPEVARYFMSVGEAAQLILQAGAIGQGGEIFVLEMGKPIRILDLVKDMIRLQGLEPEEDVPIKIIGLRPGEKMFEELITEGEGIVATGRDKIMVLKGDSRRFEEIKPKIDDLLEAAQAFDAPAIKARLKELVPEYTPR